MELVLENKYILSGTAGTAVPTEAKSQQLQRQRVFDSHSCTHLQLQD